MQFAIELATSYRIFRWLQERHYDEVYFDVLFTDAFHSVTAKRQGLLPSISRTIVYIHESQAGEKFITSPARTTIRAVVEAAVRTTFLRHVSPKSLLGDTTRCASQRF